MKKKLALLLAAVMTVSAAVPMTAFAASTAAITMTQRDKAVGSTIKPDAAPTNINSSFVSIDFPSGANKGDTFSLTLNGAFWAMNRAGTDNFSQLLGTYKYKNNVNYYFNEETATNVLPDRTGQRDAFKALLVQKAIQVLIVAGSATNSGGFTGTTGTPASLTGETLVTTGAALSVGAAAQVKITDWADTVTSTIFNGAGFLTNQAVSSDDAVLALTAFAAPSTAGLTANNVANPEIFFASAATGHATGVNIFVEIAKLYNSTNTTTLQAVQALLADVEQSIPSTTIGFALKSGASEQQVVTVQDKALYKLVYTGDLALSTTGTTSPVAYIELLENLNVGDDLYIPIVARTTANNVTVSIAPESQVSVVSSAGPLDIVATVGGGGWSVDSTVVSNNSFPVELKFSESAPKSVTSGTKTMLAVAPDGYHWDTSKEITFTNNALGFAGASGHATYFSTTNIGTWNAANDKEVYINPKALTTAPSTLGAYEAFAANRVVELSINVSPSTNVKGVFTVKGLELVKDAKSTKLGAEDVMIVPLYNLYTAMTPVADGVTIASADAVYNNKAASYGTPSFTGLFSAGANSDPYASTRKFTTIANVIERQEYTLGFGYTDSEDKAAVLYNGINGVTATPVTFKEMVPMAWLAQRYTEFVLVDADGEDISDQVKIVGVESTTTGFEADNDEEYTTADSSDAVLEVYEDRVIVNSDKEVAKKHNLELILDLSAAPGFKGDVFLQVQGAGLSTNEAELTNVHIATFNDAYTIDMESASTQFANTTVELSSITVKEAAKSLFNTGNLVITLEGSSFGTVMATETVEFLNFNKVKVEKSTTAKGSGAVRLVTTGVAASRTDASQIVVGVTESTTNPLEFTVSNLAVYVGNRHRDTEFDLHVTGSALANNLITAGNDPAKIETGEFSAEYAFVKDGALVIGEGTNPGTTEPGTGTGTGTTNPTSGVHARVVIKPSNTTAVVNGEEVSMDLAPVIVGGRTMLPVRSIAKVLGLADSDVTWDPVTPEIRKVHVRANGVIATFQLDNAYVVVNGNAMRMTVPDPMNLNLPTEVSSVMVDGVSYVPYAWLCKAIGINFGWDVMAGELIINPTADEIAQKNLTSY